MTRHKIALIVTIVYLMGAVSILTAFLMAPAAGLTNVLLMAWTLPATLLLLGLLFYPFGIPFPFVSSIHSFGYVTDHVIYFVPIVMFLAWRLYKFINTDHS